MIEEMKSFVKNKKTCVLATATDNNPHCSLMAYVTDDDCREIYMVTSRKSKKFHNLSENPSVSLLIDTREEDSASQNPKTRALTIAGVYTQLADENKKTKIRSEMVSKHPAIRDLIKNPNAEILCIKIVSFLLLNGPTEAHFERLE
jgi:nitroimidazol reductase NimA-like FMN-containing flavoprotein (pyridoxamine 5'-phosphate oxidase superfamily)